MAFDNKLADSEATSKRLNGNNPATSCTNVTNFHLIILELLLLKRAVFAAIRPQFADRSLLVLWRSVMDWNIAILISEE